MKKLYILLLAVSFVTANSQIINFPIPALKAEIVSSSNGVDTNSDGEIDMAEAAVAYGLGLSNHANYEGLQYFTNLHILYISNSNPGVTSDLSVIETLATVDDLTILNVDVSGILDLSAMTLLNRLSITGTNLNKIIVHGQSLSTNYTTELGGNKLTSVDFLTPGNGSDLNVSYNLLTDLEASWFTGFWNVNINYNPIISLDPAGILLWTTLELPSLQYIKMPPNSYNAYFFYNTPNLTTMDFRNNNNDLPIAAPMQFNIPPSVEVVCVDNNLNEFDSFFSWYDYCSLNFPSGCATSNLPNGTFTPYCDLTQGTNTVTGQLNFDCGGANQPMENVPVNISGSGLNYTSSSNILGDYLQFANQGSYTVTPLLNPAYFSVTPPQYDFTFASDGNNPSADFCVTAIGAFADLDVTITPTTVASAGFTSQYAITLRNKGTQTLSGTTMLNFEGDLMDYLSSSQNVDAQTANSLSWNFTDLNPFESRTINLTMQLNSPMDTPALNPGMMVLFSASINSAAVEETPDDNTHTYNQTIVGPLDPNDKEVLEGATVALSDADEFLHYVIRFQNLGTAEAHNVVISDQLSTLLDKSTFEVTSASHEYRYTISNTDKLEVFFEGIDLPAESADEPGSHGYVSFKIKPVSTVQNNNTISNSADIFFDFNYPIATNTVETTFTTLGTTQFNTAESFTIYPNPASSVIHLAMADGVLLRSVSISNAVGQLLVYSNKSDLDISSLPSGTYFVIVESTKGKTTKKIVKL